MTTGHPLYLRIVLEELRVFGVYERVDIELGDMLRTKGVIQLFDLVMTRWEKKYGIVKHQKLWYRIQELLLIELILCRKRNCPSGDQCALCVSHRSWWKRIGRLHEIQTRTNSYKNRRFLLVYICCMYFVCILYVLCNYLFGKLYFKFIQEIISFCLAGFALCKKRKVLWIYI